MEGFQNLGVAVKGELRRGEASLRRTLPLPAGKGIKGMGNLSKPN